MTVSRVRLGVNIDHIATLRQQRFTPYPDLGEAIDCVEQAGADGITMHLREDRRHVQLEDVEQARKRIRGTLNLEMAPTDEMLAIAERIGPDYCCFVPERREELTTEGGLDLVTHAKRLKTACTRLQAADIQVSLFVEPTTQALEVAQDIGATMVELHTGRYADAQTQPQQDTQLERLNQVNAAAQTLPNLTINAGHGLHRDNVAAVAALPGLYELNIGHAIVCRAVMVGLAEAVREIRVAMTST